MSRYVWQQGFALFSRELNEAVTSGRMREPAFGALLREAMRDAPPPERMSVPVALRWVTRPDVFGFPRQPFKVYRRPPSDKFQKIADGVRSFKADEYVFVEWGMREMHRVRFLATPDTAAPLTVEALDLQRNVIPGQTIAFTAAGTGVFRSPGVAALRVTGLGAIANIVGVDQQAYANEPDLAVNPVGRPARRDGRAGATGL